MYRTQIDLVVVVFGREWVNRSFLSFRCQVQRFVVFGCFIFILLDQKGFRGLGSSRIWGGYGIWGRYRMEVIVRSFYVLSLFFVFLFEFFYRSFCVQGYYVYVVLIGDMFSEFINGVNEVEYLNLEQVCFFGLFYLRQCKNIFLDFSFFFSFLVEVILRSGQLYFLNIGSQFFTVSSEISMMVWLQRFFCLVFWNCVGKGGRYDYRL